MTTRRKRETHQGCEKMLIYPSDYGNKSAKNLSKSELGGVIFGCKNHTIGECLSKQLFGLPHQHINFVRKIETGLTLFLFNYSDRKLHGIYEASSPGDLNIDPYAWTNGAKVKTEFPAQVRIGVRMLCQPITEKQFKSVISGNYYMPGKFYFELTHAQTEGLIALFLDSNKSAYGSMEQCNNGTASIIDAYKKSMEENQTYMDASTMDVGITQILENREVGGQHHSPYVPKYMNQLPGNSFDHLKGNSDLLESIEELKKKTATLEAKQLESESEMEELRSFIKDSASEIQQLNHYVKELELKLFQAVNSEKVIYLMGGYNGNSWLSSLDSFSPSKDNLIPHGKMNSVRGYASSAVLGDTVYIFGGGDGKSWFSSVECYNPRNDNWTLCSPLTREKGSLAGASLNDKIYALGGGNGSDCFSDVEMFAPSIGKWIYHQPMLQKRFAPAAAVLHDTLYVTGGYDGNNYLQYELMPDRLKVLDIPKTILYVSRTIEMLDPREGCWRKVPDMNVRRGCHSVSVFNEKLYVMGGFNGEKMSSTVEYFDPRNESWIECASMNHARGYANAAAVGGFLFVMSGVDDDNNIIQTVECFSEVTGWIQCNNKAIGKRCFFSAVVPP